MDTLLREAIKASQNNETVSEAILIQHEAEEKASSLLHSSESQASAILVIFLAPCI